MFKQNDILVDKQGNERKVLGVCGEVVFCKRVRGSMADTSWHTEEELKEDGWTLKQEKWKPEPESIYFYFDSYGKICDTIWMDEERDNHRLSVGNCHRTEFNVLVYKQKLIQWASGNK